MATVKPSFDRKLDRAAKHRRDLKEAVLTYAASNPYTVGVGVEGKRAKRRVHRLRLTAEPDAEIGLIAADCVYNIRSGLDHIAAALVPYAYRRDVMFPIFFHGVWDRPIPSENKGRTKNRQRWATSTRHMHPDAVAILEQAQPDKAALNETTGMPSLVVLNRLSSRDRHTNLPVMTTGMKVVSVSWQLPEGTRQPGRPTLDRKSDYVENGAELEVPDGAVDVRVEGSPLVLIRVSGPDRDVAVPQAFDLIIDYARTLIDGLRPFVVGP